MSKKQYRAIHTFIICIILVSFGPASLLAQNKVWSLNECIERALHENVSLNQSIANNELNKVSYDQARANRLPNLNLSDSHSMSYGNPIDPLTGKYNSENTSVNTLALTSSVTIYAGLKNINLIKENKLNYEAGNLDIEKARNDLKLNVIAAYMQVLFEHEAVNITQSQIDATIEHLNYTAQYVRAGNLPESSLLQMQAQLATDKAAKVDAENQLQLAKVVLMQLMEFPVTGEFDIEHPDMKELLPDVTMKADDIYKVAEGHLPEVRSAATKILSAETAHRVSKGDILPKLTLSGSVGTQYSSANSLYSYRAESSIEHIGYLASDPSQTVDGPVYKTVTNSSNYPFFRQMGDNFGQGISLTLSVPIFNNLSYKSDIRRSEVRVRVAKLNEQLVKNQLRKSIEMAYADQLAASKNYIATREQLGSEERSYKNITLKFSAGSINTTDLFVEKTIYNKALLAHLQAKYEYLYKTKILNFYLNEPLTN